MAAADLPDIAAKHNTPNCEICTKSVPAFLAFAAFFAHYESILVRKTHPDTDIDDISPQPLSFLRHLRHKNSPLQFGEGLGVRCIFCKLKTDNRQLKWRPNLFRHRHRRHRRHFRLKDSQIAQNPCAEFEEIAEICENYEPIHVRQTHPDDDNDNPPFVRKPILAMSFTNNQ